MKFYVAELWEARIGLVFEFDTFGEAVEQGMKLIEKFPDHNKDEAKECLEESCVFMEGDYSVQIFQTEN